MNPHNLATTQSSEREKIESHLENGAADDDAVKSVEGRVEVGCQTKSIHPHTW